MIVGRRRHCFFFLLRDNALTSWHPPPPHRHPRKKGGYFGTLKQLVGERLGGDNKLRAGGRQGRWGGPGGSTGLGAEVRADSPRTTGWRRSWSRRWGRQRGGRGTPAWGWRSWWGNRSFRPPYCRLRSGKHKSTVNTWFLNELYYIFITCLLYNLINTFIWRTTPNSSPHCYKHLESSVSLDFTILVKNAPFFQEKYLRGFVSFPSSWLLRTLPTWLNAGVFRVIHTESLCASSVCSDVTELWHWERYANCSTHPRPCGIEI